MLSSGEEMYSTYNGLKKYYMRHVKNYKSMKETFKMGEICEQAFHIRGNRDA